MQSAHGIEGGGSVSNSPRRVQSDSEETHQAKVLSGLLMLAAMAPANRHHVRPRAVHEDPIPALVDSKPATLVEAKQHVRARHQFHSGSVEVNINGQMSRGSFTRGNYLNLNGATASVTRQGNGILTTRTDTGERISYTRDQWGGNNNQSGNWGGNSGNGVDVSDLVGARASSGQSELRSRGFRNVDTFKTGNTSYTIWWRRSSGQCIQVATADGRFDSVSDIGSHPKCN